MGVEDKLFTKRKGGLSVYIKRFVKHYYIMLIPALLWLLFLQYRSDVRYRHGIPGL